MKLFLTGGFLGSGKTTAIRQACHYLQQLNIKAGVITNDQGNQQVDTRFIKSNNIATEEVADSCFCCNYPAFESGLKSLQQTGHNEIIFAESVGSCTDLAATIINPLLQFSPGEYDIILSVFADIRLLVMHLQNNAGIFFEEVSYIYKKQLEEADIIIVNKIDLVTPMQLEAAKHIVESKYPGKKILYQNSLSQENIKEWIDIMLYRLSEPGMRKTLLIDYDIYGRGEAWLTWLDQDIIITCADNSALHAAQLLAQKIHQNVHNGGYATGHIKFFIDTGNTQQKLSFTTLQGEGVFETAANKTPYVKMLVNARVQTTPESLAKIIADAIAETMCACPCSITVTRQSCFIPGYPKPTHRVAG
jgi:G3E family GTPase